MPLPVIGEFSWSRGLPGPAAPAGTCNWDGDPLVLASSLQKENLFGAAHCCGAFVVVPRPAAEVHAWYALAVLYSDLLMPTHVKEN